MKILYYDCFSGISGDMNLGALMEVGVNKDYLIKEIEKLNLHGYTINITKDLRKGIKGTKVDVICEHHHHHEHRNLDDIVEIINNSSLNNNVKKISSDIFKIVAVAEAKVHEKDLKEVHFHEVGAIDSIIDIVGAAICIDYLKPDKIIASTVEVGSGFVKCAHGTLPVPAPATAEILKGIPIKSNGIPFEATTPTGAAILAYACQEFSDNKDFKITSTGYGIGCKDLGDVPNVLRVFMAEENKDSNIKEEVMVMETNIDDMNPEKYEYIMEELIDQGAIDVFFTPLIMKKGRPGINISILTDRNNEENIKDVLFNNSSTIGIRKYMVKRDTLRREYDYVETSFGKVKVKNSFYKGKMIKSKPEYEYCKRLAKENNVNINKVYDEVYKIILR